MRLIDADAMHLGCAGNENCCGMCAEITLMPTADAVPVRHGRWVDTPIGAIKCSECGRGYYLVDTLTHYCPNCGAKMDGGNEDAVD